MVPADCRYHGVGMAQVLWCMNYDVGMVHVLWNRYGAGMKQVYLRYGAGIV